jgi:hypothetical protein
MTWVPLGDEPTSHRLSHLPLFLPCYPRTRTLYAGSFPTPTSTLLAPPTLWPLLEPLTSQSFWWCSPFFCIRWEPRTAARGGGCWDGGWGGGGGGGVRGVGMCEEVKMLPGMEAPAPRRHRRWGRIHRHHRGRRRPRRGHMPNSLSTSLPHPPSTPTITSCRVAAAGSPKSRRPPRACGERHPRPPQGRWAWVKASVGRRLGGQLLTTKIEGGEDRI